MEDALPSPRNFYPGKPDHCREEYHDDNNNIDDHDFDDNGEAGDHIMMVMINWR